MRDFGQEGFLSEGILVRRDFGQEGFWSGGILVRRDFGIGGILKGDFGWREKRIIPYICLTLGKA